MCDRLYAGEEGRVAAEYCRIKESENHPFREMPEGVFRKFFLKREQKFDFLYTFRRNSGIIRKTNEE